MMLGKRQRPPMKRTTSMTEFTLDLNHTTAVDAGSNSHQPPHDHCNSNSNSDPFKNMMINNVPPRSTSASAVSSKTHRRNSGEFTQTTHFLRDCYLCKRRLIAGRDIFMYRGDSAFCSLECRQKQMNQDEKKEKCSMASNKHSAPVIAM